MLKKVVLGLALSAGLMSWAPAASANECMLHHDCYFVDYNSHTGESGYWVCPSPGIYALCDGG